MKDPSKPLGLVYRRHSVRMAGGRQVSADAIPPIVTRVGKEVDALDGGKDFEGGLGVGEEPLLV
jgi:hypothetical protein